MVLYFILLMCCTRLFKLGVFVLIHLSNDLFSNKTYAGKIFFYEIFYYLQLYKRKQKN